MSANITRDVIKLWAPKVSDKSMLMLGYLLIALFLFLPFYWTWGKMRLLCYPSSWVWQRWDLALYFSS